MTTTAPTLSPIGAPGVAPRRLENYVNGQWVGGTGSATDLFHAVTGDKIADLFDELHSAHRLTSVFVTHNLDFAKRCDRILKLDHGALVALQGEEPPEITASKEDGTNHV